MDKVKLEKWLDKLAKVTKQFTNIKDFSEDIQICTTNTRGLSNKPYVQIYCGIEQIAETLELGLRR